MNKKLILFLVALTISGIVLAAGSNIIEINKAEHLDENREFISDIYDEVYQLDKEWSSPIYPNEYVRIRFKENLTSENDIRIYPRILIGSPEVEVYEVNKDEKIAEFKEIKSNQYNRVLLTNLQGSQDTFDLKITGGTIEINHIIDPSEIIFEDDFEINDWAKWSSHDNMVYDNTRAQGGTTWSAACLTAADTVICVLNTTVIDLSDSTSFNLSLWYNEDDCEAADSALLFYDDTGTWDLIANIEATALGCAEDTWCSYSYTTSDSQYLHSNFMFKFDLNPEKNENIWFDTISLNKTTPEPQDEEYPIFSNYQEEPNNASIYISGQTYEFNTTITRTNGTVGLGFNGENYTATNLTADMFNVTLPDLAAGVYSYYWWAYGNGTDNKFNTTEEKSYTVLNATGNITLLLNGNEENLTITYPQQLNASASTLYGTLTLYRDGNIIDSENNLNVTLGGGYYNYTAFSSGDQNHSSATITYWANITRADNSVTLLLNGQADNASLVYPQQLNASASSEGGTVYIFREGEDKTSENSENITLSAGYYQYIANATGDQNYTDNSTGLIYYTNITQAASSVNLTLNYTQNNITISEGTSIDLNCSNINGDSGATLTLFRENNAINQDTSPIGNTTTFNTAQLENITCTYTNSQNYTSSSETWWVNVTELPDITPPNVILVSPTDGQNFSVNTIELNCSMSDSGDGLKNSTIYGDWGGSWHANDTQLITGSENSTSFTKTISEGTYKWNCYVCDQENPSNCAFNNTNWTFTIDTTYPEINIVYPLEGSNFSYSTIDVNYTSSDTYLESCWWTNSSGEYNNSITCGENITGETWDEGSNTVIVYSNDTAGNVNSSSVTFTVDTTAPAISIVYPSEGSNFSYAVVDVNYTVSSGGVSCWWTNSSGEYNNSITCGENITGETWDEGSNTVTVYTNDTAGNENLSSVTFNIDLTAPSINIISPINQNYTTTTIDFNVSLSEKGDWCGFSLDHAADITMTKLNSTYFNHTETGLSQGAHNVTYSCNDTVGNMNSSSGIINFTIDSIGPTLSDANADETNITLNAYFCLNITSTDSSGISYVLAEVWNTTNFVNYSMTDEGTSCGGTGGDNIYGADIQGTAVGEWNYSRAHSNDSLNNWNTNDFTDISINVTAPLNNPPTDPSPELTSVDGTNYTSSDLNCSSIITDLDSGDTLNVTVLWYKDDIVNLTINFNENYNNGTLFSATLDSGNTSVNDEWKCGLRLYDGISYSNWVNSSSITILEFPYPQFSNIVASPDNNTEYSPNAAYQFNVTISDTNGTAGIEFNGVNYTASNESSVFTTTISNLAAGTYPYYWWAYNGDYSNTTTIKYYTISKNTSTTTLDINETSPIVYGTYINVTCETTNQEETIKLYREGNDVSSEIAESILLGVGTYNYVCNITETQNYTNSSDSDSFTVNKAAGDISLLLNGTASNQTDIYGVQTNASASTLYGTLTLYRNSIDVTSENNDYITLGVGNWNWTATSSGNQNYSSATITRWSHITKASSSVNLYLNHSQDNITIEEDTKIWLNATIQTGEGAIELYNNGTLINSGSSPLANFTNFTSPGIYNITTVHPSTQNYSGSSTTLWVNVTAFVDTTFPLVTITSPEEINYSISVIEFNVSLNEAGFCQYSLDAGITNITMTSNSSDTGFNATNSSIADGQYTSNFYCNDTAGNLNSTESISFGIDSTAPAVTLISPANNTFNDTTNTIDFYYNVTDTNSIANCSLTINYAINKTSDSPAKETTNNITTYLPNGDYLWGVNCTDQIGNTGTSEIFNISINYTDSTPPSVTQNSPAEDYTGTTSDPMPVTFDCSATDNNALKNISLYITNNQNESFSLNQTTDLSGTSDSATWLLNLANGNYTWNCLAYDEYNNQDWGDNRSILINYVPSVAPISGGGARKECYSYTGCEEGYTCINNKCIKFFDAKITDLKLPIQAGEFLNFTYFIKGVAIIDGDVIVEFRLEKDNQTVTSGSDTIFIGRMEEKTETASLFLPTTMEGGTYDFYVTVNYENYKAEAHRKIEIEQALLSKLSILLIKMPSPRTGKELEFSFNLKPLKDLPMPIKLKEEIKKDGEVVWFKEMDLIIEKETSLTEKAGKLEAGDYLLEITSYYKGQTSRFAQSFTVKEARAFNIYPILIILLAIISFLYFRRKLKLKRLKKAIKNELGKVIKSVKKIKITEDRISEPPKKEKVVIEKPEEEPRGATIVKKKLKGIVINIGDFDALGTKLKEGLRKGYIEKGANKVVKTLRDVRERFRHRLEKANIKKRANKIARRFSYMKAGLEEGIKKADIKEKADKIKEGFNRAKTQLRQGIKKAEIKERTDNIIKGFHDVGAEFKQGLEKADIKEKVKEKTNLIAKKAYDMGTKLKKDIKKAGIKEKTERTVKTLAPLETKIKRDIRKLGIKRKAKKTARYLKILGKKIIKASGKILKKIKKKEPSYVRSLKKLRSNYNKSSTTILFKPE